MNKTIAVCITTYNHELYIAQCIDSVLSQKIDQPVTLYIGEDCSTDNTRNICIAYHEQYPEKIKLLLQDENLGLVKNTFQILNKIEQDEIKYIAMLDGDDYWVDDYKLQKQFDFLENNPNYGLVHTNISLSVNNKIVNNPRKNIPTGNVFDKISDFSIGNCSVMFRTNLLMHIDSHAFVSNHFMSVDYVMYVIFSKHTKFGFMDDTTAVWRRGHDSVSNTNQMHKQIHYLNNDINMWKYLGSLYPERFAYDVLSAEAYVDYRTFNIAFKYKNFELAHNILKKRNLQKRNLIFELKKISARNKFLFYIWCWLKEKK